MTEVVRIKTQPSRAALHAIEILESFDSENAVQTLAGISRRLRIPKATALRTLRALEQRRYVSHDAKDGTYALSIGILALAQRYLTRYEALTVARPLLAELAKETGETAHFGVLQGTEVVYLDIAESPQRVRAYVLRGDRIPAHCAAAGKVMLAYADPKSIEAFAGGNLQRMTPATLIEPAALLRDLRATRKRGYGLNIGEWMTDVTGVSAPVFGSTGKVEGAIGVAGPATRLNVRKAHQLGQTVRLYADRISQSLGGMQVA